MSENATNPVDSPTAEPTTSARPIIFERPIADMIHVSGHQEGAAWVVALAGELDMCCDAAVQAGFAHARPAGCERIVVDLSRVTFIDCGGLRALQLAGHGWGGEVWVRAPSEAVRWFAGLVGLDQTGSWADASTADVRLC